MSESLLLIVLIVVLLCGGLGYTGQIAPGSAVTIVLVVLLILLITHRI